MYKGEGVAFDPEGLVRTVLAIVQVLFGCLVGYYILAKGKTYEMIAGLFVIGCMLIFAGFCWDRVFPINKEIWSSSFVVSTTGLAVLVLCVLLYTIEMQGQQKVTGENRTKGWSGGSRFFDVFALFIFFVSGILPRVYALFHIPDGPKCYRGDCVQRTQRGGL